MNVDSAYIGAGYDSRYAGSKLSPKEIDAIRARYQYLKARGDLTLQQIKDLQTMYANLKATHKERPFVFPMIRPFPNTKVRQLTGNGHI
ncbi:TPA: hypothetical protein ACHU7U_000917 [Streptococcus suis]